MASTEKKSTRRTYRGEVVSDKMDKTVIVRVDRTVMHSKYKKRYTRSKRYKVHDESGKCKVGDEITFIECRPLSRDKKWRVLTEAEEKDIK